MSHGSHNVAGDPYLAQVYWMFAGGAIALATVVNVVELGICWRRLSAASKSQRDPARPKNPVLRAYATLTAIVREASGYAPPLLPSRNFPALSAFPQLGRILLVAANLALLLSIIFYGWSSTTYVRNFEPIAIRCGWMTVTQIPLVFLLAGKRNIIGYLTGSSYERINWLHRWVSRCLFITASIHFSFFLKSWAASNYVDRMFKINPIARHGLGAWCLLAWLTFSSFAPVRGWRYEFFVVQHFVSFVGFVTMVMIHTPVGAHGYVWAPVGIYFVDRVVRSGYMIYHNLAIFHPKKATGAFTCTATFTPLPDRATRIDVLDPPFSWRPGQHVFLACHSLAPLQSHPFTITSLPGDGLLSFVIRAQSGGTSRIFKYAENTLPRLTEAGKTVFIDGPYGRLRPLEQFDAVTFLAGGAGASFTVPLLRDLVRLKREQKPLVTKRIRFVWVVKGRGQISWFSRDLSAAVEAAEAAGLDLDVNIYVTCDPVLTNSSSASTLPATEEKPKLLVEETERSPAEAASDDLCGTDRCRCQNLVDNEDGIAESGQRECCCDPSPASSPSPPLSPPTSTETVGPKTASVRSRDATSALDLGLPEISNVVAGRPAVRRVIARELERARGESAVVVCGPRGLVQCTRQAVGGLSDERAVHKGTGAQGIYLHTETFSW